MTDTPDDEVTQAAIGNVLTGMMQRIDAEYDTMSEDDLRQRWYFTYRPEQSVEWNMYSFFEMLGLYRGACRRWEEKHHGHMMVVERVRDKYLMPKIREFAAELASRTKETTP